VVLGYLALLLASDVVRWLDPYRPALEPDERAVTVSAIDGERQLAAPVRLAYLEYEPPGGDTLPVIVVVHGSPGSNREVGGVAELLGNDFHTLAPDLPGFGGSSRAVPDYSNRAHARYLLEWLDSLHIRKVHLVGYSMGGGVVLQLAGLAPDRVRSITLLSAIGAQEYELFGDYYLNHLVHGVQLAGLWLLREGTPHFGWLDDAVMDIPYARNFYDTDQRPLRGILTRYQGPMLILQGQRDVLVNPAIAYEHARIVPQSELVMDDGDHFTTFMHPERVAAPIRDFVERVDRGLARTRSSADPARLAQAAKPFDPTALPRTEGLAAVILLLVLAGATLVSEDLACITAGLMVARGNLGFAAAVLACFAGIYVGDLLLFLAGRVMGRAALHRAPLKWLLPPEAVEWSSRWLERRGAALVLLTRVMPGTRLPTYLAAGMLRTSFPRFALYFLVACALWTPLLVGASAGFGEATQHAVSVLRARTGLYLLVSGLLLLVLLKLTVALATWRGRRLLYSRWLRLTRWEFWPRWAFYPPVVAYILWLAARHRGLRTFTAANPAIPGGGFVGESKSGILRGLADHPHLVAEHQLIPSRLSPAERTGAALEFRERHGLDWPIVLKPDVGERGSGVAIVRSETAVRDYLQRARGDIIVQAYAHGEEFGVFYIRHPSEASGRIFSITEKRFPQVTGDGQSSLERLILGDARAVTMARFHLRRHGARLDWVPAPGEVVPLVELGTHCRGAAFFDGGWAKTPALEETIDRLSRGFPGFWFGRYDIRTSSVAEFRQGRSFKVVELNGATAEATSIYDPRNGLWGAYRILFTQWRRLFEVGRANMENGASPTSWGELWDLFRRHGAELRTHGE